MYIYGLCYRLKPHSCLCDVLLLGAILMWMACALVMSRPVLLPRAISMSVVLLQPGSVLISMVHATREGQADICGLPVLPSEAILVSTDHAAAKGHADLNSLCCYLRPCRYLWYSLPLRDFSVSMAPLQLGAVFMDWAVARNYPESGDLCHHWQQRARRLFVSGMPMTTDAVVGNCSQASPV